MNKITVRLSLIVSITLIGGISSYGQTAIPEILYKGSVTDQMTYIETRTNIYQDYRAIREDMFQLIKKNAIDSLASARNRNTGLLISNSDLKLRIDTLNNTLATTNEDLREMTRTKNAITILGISLNKNVYNSIMWIIVAALLFLLVTGYLAFKKSFSVLRNSKNELAELKKEFDEYRTKTRLEREKMSMDHFKEVQKLKGKA